MKSVTILGAIAGDVIGSQYEFNPTKDYRFPLLDQGAEITDDSILTVAVADWKMNERATDHDFTVARIPDDLKAVVTAFERKYRKG